MRLEGGESLVIRGPSGSGKSTLLQALAGIVPDGTTPRPGSVVIGKTDIYALGDHDRSVFRGRHIGYLPQHNPPIPQLTFEENVALPHELAGYRVGHRSIGEALDSVGLGHRHRDLARSLSGGEEKRLGLASLFVGTNRYGLYCLDEPTAPVAPADKEAINGLIATLAANGATVVVASHESAPATWAIELRDGRLQSGDAPVLSLS